MKADGKWTALGWKHPLWDIVRFYLSLRGSKIQARFRDKLRNESTVAVSDVISFPVSPEVCELFVAYMSYRQELFARIFTCLRVEEKAIAYCRKLKVTPKQTTTQKDHHQSSKSLVATVSAVAQKVCKKSRIGIDANPQSRCVWLKENGLHVSVRNVDGAIPSLFNPKIIWEIKEYWGKTSGGSKMSDAVYECHLVGLELRTYEEKINSKITHAVFVDGAEQWSARKSDLNRFVDLLNQGLIDELFVGSMVEDEWEPTLAQLLKQTIDS